MASSLREEVYILNASVSGGKHKGGGGRSDGKSLDAGVKIVRFRVPGAARMIHSLQTGHDV